MCDLLKSVTATEFKQKLGLYLEYVMNQHEVIITKNGKKAVRLLPFSDNKESVNQINEEAIKYNISDKKISYEQFMQLYDNSDIRMEYINGEVVCLSSPNRYHQAISGNVYIILREFFVKKKSKVYYAPFDVHFHKKNIDIPDVLQPDLFVACDEDEDAPPSLVVEILSKSTRSKDMVDKLNTYMLSGVKEFWIIDPRQKIIMLYTFKEYDIEQFTIYRLGETLISGVFQGLKVNVDKVFEE